MQEYPQGPGAGPMMGPPGAQGPQQGQQPGRRFQAALDPRNYDPRKMVDQQHLRDQVQRLQRAQTVARAQAQATSTIFLATVVSLATSAFGVVAALAWNDAIHEVLTETFPDQTLSGLHFSKGGVLVVYAVVTTVIAVFVILSLNRVAGRIAKKSAIDAAEADAGSI